MARRKSPPPVPPMPPGGLSGIIFRDRLKRLVREDGRPDTEIARAASMSQSQLSQILTGVRPNPTVQTVGRLLVALGRSWADLD